MNKKLKMLLLAVVMVISIAAVQADVSLGAGAVGFTVRAQIPENQINKKQTYFDLLVEKDHKQTIQIEVVNSSDETIVADVALNAASTERNGLIVYDRTDIRDESMETAITDVASVVNPKVTIPAGKSKMVDIEIDMDSRSFDGVLLGGLYVTASADREEDETVPESISLKNQYAYVVGLKLTQDEREIQPNMNLLTIEPDLSNYRTAMFVHLQNDKPVIMKNVQVTAEVYKKNSDEIFKKSNRDNVEIAPNSSFAYVIDWENEAIAAGEYRLKMKAVYEDYEWIWDEVFTISAADAGDVNDNAVGVEKTTTSWMYIIIVILLIALIVLLAYVLGRRTGRNRDR